MTHPAITKMRVLPRNAVNFQKPSRKTETSGLTAVRPRLPKYNPAAVTAITPLSWTAETVQLSGTIRALTSERFAWLRDRVVAMTNKIAAANECSATVKCLDDPYPPTVNDAGLWEHVRGFAAEMLGTESVHEIPPVMGGEDFAFYTERIPGCFVGLGVRNEETGCTHHVHHPKFKVDESALPIGSALHASFALRHLC